jgi:hypothetical protein
MNKEACQTMSASTSEDNFMCITTHGNADNTKKFIVPPQYQVCIIGVYGKCITYNRGTIDKFKDLFRFPIGLYANNFDKYYKSPNALTKHGMDWFKQVFGEHNKDILYDDSSKVLYPYTVYNAGEQCVNVELHFDYDETDLSCKALGCNITIIKNPLKNKDSVYRKVEREICHPNLSQAFQFASKRCMHGDACKSGDVYHYKLYHHPLHNSQLFTNLFSRYYRIETLLGRGDKVIQRKTIKDDFSEKFAYGILLEDLIQKYGRKNSCSTIFVFACLQMDNEEAKRKLIEDTKILKRKNKEEYKIYNSEEEMLKRAKCVNSGQGKTKRRKKKPKEKKLETRKKLIIKKLRKHITQRLKPRFKFIKTRKKK